jgi:hypothetical protein
MIVFNGGKSDYAIMKQIQQIRVSRAEIADEQIVELGDATDFSGILPDETLYIVSHGNAQTGRLRDIATITLLRWLTDQDKGLPQAYAGTIAILSCYSGQKKVGKTTLAESVAQGLSEKKVAAGAKVKGANGYSFGTPELSRTGVSSVLSTDLADFYSLDPSGGEARRARWLLHKPTHSGGALQSKLGRDANPDETISENIRKALDAGMLKGKRVDDVAGECVREFSSAGRRIEGTLDRVIKDVPGNSVPARIAHMLTNSQDPEIVKWNDAIAQQYTLFADYYLWSSTFAAFTTADVK